MCPASPPPHEEPSALDGGGGWGEGDLPFAAQDAITGLFGKLPAHGDFIRRALPDSFVTPWDAWLQSGLLAARDALGDGFPDAWSQAPAWCFRLPAGACGPDAVAGLLLPSEDLVGRLFPLTIVALLDPAAPPPAAAWYDALRDASHNAAGSADALAAALPAPWPGEDAPAEGWWRAPDAVWPLPALPADAYFRVLVEGGA
jgi:type VI secretion system protein ImpM